MSIVVTDLEGTLTTGSSWKGLRTYFKTNFDPKAYNRFFYSWIPRYMLVKAGALSRRAVMTQWIEEESNLLRGMTPDAFDRMAEWIVDRVMWPNHREQVMLELGNHHERGTEIAIVSSAYQPIVAAFARRIHAIPIGTQLIFQNDKLAGFEKPLNSYEHKVENIRARFNGQPVAAAYGDTASDIPMLQISAEPVAVHPDAALRRVAEREGWRILE